MENVEDDNEQPILDEKNEINVAFDVGIKTKYLLFSCFFFLYLKPRFNRRKVAKCKYR